MPKATLAKKIIEIRIEIKKHIPYDEPKADIWRQHLEMVCTQFLERGLADSNFVSNIKTGSVQKFWARISEALVADRLLKKKLNIIRTGNKGPDFLIMNGQKKIWVEVTCPEPCEGIIEWFNSGPVHTFPHEQILLRWTHAIKTKKESLFGSEDGENKGYLSKGIVSPGDSYVIAVNGCLLRRKYSPRLFGISNYPFAVEAVFPVGPLQCNISLNTGKIISSDREYRPIVLKEKKISVHTNIFLDTRYSLISAIWALDINGGASTGRNVDPTAIVHNPYAANPIPDNFLPADYEYALDVEDDKLAEK